MTGVDDAWNAALIHAVRSGNAEYETGADGRLRVRFTDLDQLDAALRVIADAWRVSIDALLAMRPLHSRRRPGSVILDPFSGSGTTAAVAQRLGRRWIGIDDSDAAIRVATDRLRSDATQQELGSRPAPDVIVAKALDGPEHVYAPDACPLCQHPVDPGDVVPVHPPGDPLRRCIASEREREWIVRQIERQ